MSTGSRISWNPEPSALTVEIPFARPLPIVKATRPAVASNNSEHDPTGETVGVAVGVGAVVWIVVGLAVGPVLGVSAGGTVGLDVAGALREQAIAISDRTATVVVRMGVTVVVPRRPSNVGRRDPQGADTDTGCIQLT